MRITITIVIFCYVWIKDGMHAEYLMHSEYSVYMFSEMFLFKCGAKHLTQASHFINSLHFKSPPPHSSSFCMFIAQSILGRAGPDHEPFICLDCNYTDILLNTYSHEKFIGCGQCDGKWEITIILSDNVWAISGQSQTLDSWLLPDLFPLSARVLLCCC